VGRFACIHAAKGCNIDGMFLHIGSFLKGFRRGGGGGWGCIWFIQGHCSSKGGVGKFDQL
jgi:hypothetical protein